MLNILQTKYIKNLTSLFSGNVISQVIPFVLAPFITRIYGPIEMGQFAQFIALVSLLGIIAAGRLELAILLPLPEAAVEKIIRTAFIITIAVSLSCFIFVIFKSQLKLIYGESDPTSFIAVLPLGVFSIGILGILNNIAVRKQKFLNLSFGKILQSLTNSGTAIISGLLSAGTWGLVIAWLASQFVNIAILINGIVWPFKMSRLWKSEAKNVLREHRDFPIVNALHAFSDLFLTQVVLFWVIERFYGNYDLGVFSTMIKYVKAPMIIITSAVAQLFYSEISMALKEKKDIKPLFKKTFTISALFGIPLVLCLFTFGPKLFSFYLGTVWESGGHYARYLTSYFLLFTVVSPISVIPILAHQQKTSFLYNAIGNLICVFMFCISFYLGFPFKMALLIYGISLTVYQFMLLLWFKRLISSLQ
jgi:O-antigen/teichoic acid export membrane protein